MESEIEVIRRFLKERFRRDLTFRDHEDEVNKIFNLFQNTSDGESNSALLIGPRGSGKTTLVNYVIYQLIQNKDFCNNTIIVHLNGLLHTDDGVALKSITIQLDLENAVNGKVFGSYAENLQFLLDSLKSGGKQSKSAIFILEEFDLFCSHTNQLLLYNLFDISQSKQAPICVLGITCRDDVVELLEKRVKSRFSHRQISLLPDNENFDERLNLMRILLKLPTSKELKTLRQCRPVLNKFKINSNLTFLRNIFDPTNYEFSQNCVQKWNTQIEKLADDLVVINCLKGIYDFNTTQDYFKTFLFKIVSTLGDKHLEISPEDFQFHYKSYVTEDDRIKLLTDLSVLEICLLISIKHHSEIYDRDPFNFEIIFIRFRKFSKTNSTWQSVERAVVLKAFEHLKELEFILPVSSSAGKIQKEFRMYNMALTYSQIKQAIANYQHLPTEVSQWAQSSIY